MATSPDRRVALVTGAAQGLGAAIARRLHADGLLVVIADINEAGAAELARSLAGSARALAIGLDVTSDESVAASVSGTLEAYGRLDVLVNNAGVISRVAAAEVDTQAWQRELDVNLGGTMRCSRAAFEALSQGENACIINLASVGSTFGLPLRVAYSTAKSGVVGMTRTLAAEWGPCGIRVNAIAPGYIDTRLMRSGFELGVLDERALLSRTPLRRLGTSEDVAAAASFLASADASFVSGAVLPVDGGITIDGDFRPESAKS